MITEIWCSKLRGYEKFQGALRLFLDANHFPNGTFEKVHELLDSYKDIHKDWEVNEK